MAIAGERLGAHDCLPRRRGRPRGGKVQVVRQSDHAELDLAVGAELLHGRVLARHVVAPAEICRSLLRTRVVGHDLSTRNVAQAVHVKVGNEPGAEHPDANEPAQKRTSTAVPAAPLRALNSSSIAAVWVAPTRVTPSSSTSTSASSVLIPCAALTCMCGDTDRSISFKSSIVAPVGANPVDVLTKSAPAASTSRQPRTFCSSLR